MWAVSLAARGRESGTLRRPCLDLGGSTRPRTIAADAEVGTELVELEVAALEGDGLADA
jgi:hypothetical protein